MATQLIGALKPAPIAVGGAVDAIEQVHVGRGIARLWPVAVVKGGVTIYSVLPIGKVSVGAACI